MKLEGTMTMKAGVADESQEGLRYQMIVLCVWLESTVPSRCSDIDTIVAGKTSILATMRMELRSALYLPITACRIGHLCCPFRRLLVLLSYVQSNQEP